jgi:hypothetical protein
MDRRNLRPVSRVAEKRRGQPPISVPRYINKLRDDQKNSSIHVLMDCEG